MSETDNLLIKALTGSGDVAYSWDLVQDSIEWIGDVKGTLAVTAAALSTG